MICERMIGIAACDPQGVMGKDGMLPWHCPEELHHFRSTILASPLIMGYRTFLTLPPRYFENRVVMVFTHQKLPPRSHLITVSSLDEFSEIVHKRAGSLLGTKYEAKDFYVIGGAEIFSLFLKANLIDLFILTKMKNFYEGDTFFPLSLLAGWTDLKIQETKEYNIHRLEPRRANQYL